jgi:hypothetical protein
MRDDMSEFRTSGSSEPEPKFTRLEALLGEIDRLTRSGGTDLPPRLLIQTRASIEKAHRALATYRQVAARGAGDPGEPQPDVNGELLERMYRDLKAGRRPPRL